MNCTQTREQLLAWEYGELPPSERAEVEAHLASCAACRDELTAWQSFRGKLGAFTGPAVQVNLPDLYQQAIQRNERRLRRWRRAAIAVAAAAAVVLMAVGLRLQVRVDPSRVVFSLGESGQAEPVPPEVIQPSPAGPQVKVEDLQLVRDLVRALAIEMQSRDRQYQEALLQIQTRLETLLDQTYDYAAANERDKAALYAAQFRIQKKGDSR